MRPLRTIARCFLVFLLCFGLLSWPWPGVQERYATGFRTVANFLLPTFGANGRCEFEAVEGGRADTAVKLLNARTGYTGGYHMNSRFMGYVPTVLVTSLVLATPISWKRRAWALLWGLLAVNVFIVIRVALAILREFAGLSGQHNLALFTPGKVSGALLEFAYFVLTLSSPGHVIVPVFIWCLVTFRRKEWEAFLRGAIADRRSGATSARTEVRGSPPAKKSAVST